MSNWAVRRLASVRVWVRQQRSKVDPPFVVIRRPADMRSYQTAPAGIAMARGSSFFLWPYGLWSQAWCICLLLCTFHAIFDCSPLHKIAFAFLVPIFVLIVIPFGLFFLVRSPVLLDISETATQCNSATQKYLDNCYLSRISFIPPLTHCRSYSWRPSGGLPQALSAAAYLDRFSTPPALWRWFIYHWWPAWSSYLCIIFVLLISRHLNKMDLLVLGIVWMAWSVIFAFSHLSKLDKWLTFVEDDRYAFSWILSRRAKVVELRQRFGSGLGLKPVLLAYSLLTALLIASLQIYSDPVARNDHPCFAFAWRR